LLIVYLSFNFSVVNLASDIKDLILFNEGLILPGLGGFVTHYHPAEIRKNSNLFEPPSLEIKFDSRMVKDNGLLVFHMAKKNNITEEEARSVVDEYVANLKKVLQEKGTALIDEVGTLTKDMDGNLSFIPFSGQNYRIQSFGLPEVEIPASSKPKPEIPRRTFPQPVVQPVTRKRFRVPLAAVITVLVLVGAGLVYFTGLFENYLKPLFVRAEPVAMISEESPGSIAFDHSSVAEEDTLTGLIDQQLAEQSSKEKALYYKEPVKKTEAKTESPSAEIQAASPAVQTEPPVTVAASVFPGGEYHIVAGSFLMPGNADRQKIQLEKKGYNPQIIRKNDEFFYVTLQAYDSRDMAIAEMRKLKRELDLPLWVMRR
jgi:hypothetical protein